MGSAAVQFPTHCLSSSLLDHSLVPSGLRSLFGKLQINLIVFWWMQFELLEMNNSSCGPSSKSKAGSAIPSDGSLKRKRGVFQKDLQHMMYGFGDDNNPLPETVTLVEDIVVEYITDLVHKAQDIATKRGKLLTEDFLYLMRKDYPKLHRSTELLSMHEELKQARKAFELDEEKIVTAD